MSWLLLLLSLCGIALIVNAHAPIRAWWGIGPSFFGAWLANELAAWNIVITIAVTALLVGWGALDEPVGVVGLALSVLVVLGLVRLLVIAQQARRVFEVTLEDLPPTDPPTRFRPWVVAFPFWLHDRRLQRAKNLQYASESTRRHRLDVWRLEDGRPGAPTGGAPVLFQIHGGAWIIGNKDQQGRPLMFELADRGWVCVAPNYRLSPKATFPDHLIDVKLALAWVKEHIHEYGGDPDRIVVTGGSAGGHLASLVALTANDPDYQPGFEAADTSVIGAVPIYGIYDFQAVFDVPRSRDRRFADYLARLVMKASVAENPALFASASPTSWVTDAAPPFLVIHGDHDNLAEVAQARTFVPALRSISREPVYYAELPGATHAFDVFYSVRSEHSVHGAVRFCEWVAARALTRAETPDPSATQEDVPG